MQFRIRIAVPRSGIPALVTVRVVNDPHGPQGHGLARMLMNCSGAVGHKPYDIVLVQFAGIIIAPHVLGLVADIVAEYKGPVVVALDKGDEEILGVPAGFIHVVDNLPVLGIVPAPAGIALGHVKGPEGGHDVDLVVGGNLDQTVHVLPEFLRGSGDQAVAIEGRGVVARPVNPNPDQVYVVVLEPLELGAPVVGVKVAAEEVQGVVTLLLPWVVNAIEENFLAVPVEFVPAYGDVQRATGL